MKFQIVNIEPVFRTVKGKPKDELLNVHFVTTMTPEEFAHLKASTELWGVNIEI